MPVCEVGRRYPPEAAVASVASVRSADVRARAAAAADAIHRDNPRQADEDAWMQEHLRTRQHVHHGKQAAPHGGVHSGGGHDGVEVFLHQSIASAELPSRGCGEPQIFTCRQVPGGTDHARHLLLDVESESRLESAGSRPLLIDARFELQRSQNPGSHPLAVNRIEAAHRIAGGDQTLRPVRPSRRSAATCSRCADG